MTALGFCSVVDNQILTFTHVMREAAPLMSGLNYSQLTTKLTKLKKKPKLKKRTTDFSVFNSVKV